MASLESVFTCEEVLVLVVLVLVVLVVLRVASLESRCLPVRRFQPRDPVIRARGDPAASLSKSRLIYGCYLQLLPPGQILGRPGVLDLRIETRSTHPSIWKHSLKPLPPIMPTY